jgi:hypothetical protein
MIQILIYIIEKVSKKALEKMKAKIEVSPSSIKVS